MTDVITAAVEGLFADIDSLYNRETRRIRPRPVECWHCRGRGHLRRQMRFGFTLVECSTCRGEGKL